jgi:OmcA/MtrC family decaheme c-type cytochrome
MNRTTRSRFAGLTLLVVLCTALLAGCEGDTGAAGATGPQGPAGPQGPQGPSGSGASGAVPISSVVDEERIDAEITGVTVPAGGGAPVVTFKLTNDLTQGLKGLQPADVRFTIAQLRAGTAGASSDWQSYVTRMDGSQLQGTTETAAAARFVDNGDGTYTYTFAQALTAYTGAPTYNETLTHRVGLEVRNNAPTNNAPFDFIPAGGGVTTQRLIVDNDNCQACHDVLEFHGGARFDTQYCVTCHNPHTTDGQAPNNSVDMKVMIHKIHGAEFLNETGAAPYVITGFGNTVYDFSLIVYPQDVRNCTTCHDESDTDTPQASNWRLVANRAACGTCHADINFAAGGHPGGLTFSDDTQCLDCHGPDATVNGGAVRTATAHQAPLDVQSAKFAYQVVSVTDPTGASLETGEAPRVTIKVVDPTNNNAPYDIQAVNGPFLQSSAALRVDLAWTGTEFNNVGSASNSNPPDQTTAGNAPFQPTQVTFANGATAVPGVVNNGDGTFTASATDSIANPFPLPDRASFYPGGADAALVTGSLEAILEGRPRVDTDADGVADSSGQVTASGLSVAWDGSAASRPGIVDIERCNECHKTLALHGSNRTGNTQLCATCHNANATDIRQHVDNAASTTDCFNVVGPDTTDVSIAFPLMIHSIHAAQRRQSEGAPPYVVCGNGNSVHDFSEVVYPGAINNCESCHVPPTDDNPSYYGRDPARRLAVTTHAGADRTVITDDIAHSPTVASCLSCHTTTNAVAHMKQNGGVIDGLKVVNGQVANQAETCAICHGRGHTADIREVHNISFYPLND